MKNIAITILSLLWTIALQGQVLNVSSIEKIKIDNGGAAVFQAVAISPQGDYLLVSTDSRKGLMRWDFTTGTAMTLTDGQGNGSDVRISEDGRQVVYNDISYKNKRRHHAVKSIDLSTMKKQTLLKPTRDLQGVDLQNGTVITMSGGKTRYHALTRSAGKQDRAVLSHHHLKLYLTRDGVTTQFAPNGPDERYIWSSLSPDGTRVLYYVSGHGAFVSDLDGNHIIPMGNITAPKWWDDNTIVGTREIDDQYSVILSTIVVRTLDGLEQTLTGADVIATYPLPSYKAGKIAFSTPDGGIYVIHINQ